MDGDVDGTNPHLDNPINFLAAEVGHGDIIAEKEGEPVIVILKIQGLPHPRGHLIHKAEDALILAAVLPVHQVGFKFQP